MIWATPKKTNSQKMAKIALDKFGTMQLCWLKGNLGNLDQLLLAPAGNS